MSSGATFLLLGLIVWLIGAHEVDSSVAYLGFILAGIGLLLLIVHGGRRNR